MSRGLKIGVVVGIFLVLLGLGVHTVLRFFNAPEDVEFGLLNTFVATFASTMLTFFICILAADYQIERDNKDKIRRLETLLEAELAEISASLTRSVPAKVRVSDGSSAEFVVSRMSPVILDDALGSGLFSGGSAKEAVSLLTGMRAYDAKVSYLTAVLSTSGDRDPETERDLMAHARELEESRQRILNGLRSLTEGPFVREQPSGRDPSGS